MKTALIGIGLPGSGKSTVLKQLAVLCGAAYICPDDIREELTGDAADQSRNGDVWIETYRRIHAELDNGNSVIVDATNAKARDRLNLLRHCDKKAEQIIGLWFVTPYQICQERNLARDRVVPITAMERMACWLYEDPPSLDEGFDELCLIDTSD